jgi:hypothetical protein
VRATYSCSGVYSRSSGTFDTVTPVAWWRVGG